MEISFIICNYNYSKYISRAIESIAKQAFPSNLELKKDLIIVDDGSTDDSITKIKEAIKKYNFCFENIFLIPLDENSGKLHCLNLCMEYIQKEYTLIVDSDDYLSMNFIDETYKLISKSRIENPRIGFIYTDCILIDEDENVLTKGLSTAWEKELIFFESYIPECALTLSKVIKEASPFDTKIRVGTKHHKWKKIISNGWEGIHCSQPLFYYRMHNLNLSGIGNKIRNNTNSYDAKILSGYWTK